MGRSTRKLAAFTLIELLVVVSILSALVALLLPGVRKVREQADSVTCMANLRQMGAAMNAYCIANRFTFPDDATRTYGGHTHVLGWSPFLMGTVGPTYIATDENTHCPRMNKQYPGRYGMIGTKHDGEGGGTGPKITETVRPTTEWPSMEIIRFHCILQPADFILFADTSADDGTHVQNGQWPDSGCEGFAPNGMTTGSNFRNAGLWLAHPNQTANGLFADGHVENCDRPRLKYVANPNYFVTRKHGIDAWKLNDLTIITDPTP